jgi:hypothetical protein
LGCIRFLLSNLLDTVRVAYPESTGRNAVEGNSY